MQTKDKSTLLTFNISSLHLQSTVYIAAGQYDYCPALLFEQS